jgi:hypothetical protein
MMVGRSAARTALAIVVVLTSLAACSGDDPRPPIVIDEKQPFALFLGEALGVIDYAQLKMTNQCLAEDGYRHNLETMVSGPRNPFDNLIVTARTFGPTAEAEARRLGFGMDLPAAPPAVVSSDATYDRVLERCSTRGWKRLGDAAHRTYIAYFELGNDLSRPLMRSIDARLDPRATGGMLACVKDKGYRISDEAAFRRTPSPRLIGATIHPPETGDDWQPRRIPGTVEVGPPTPARRYEASPAEGAMAVDWLRCRRTSGLADNQLAVAVEIQRELVIRHETQFVELNPEIEQVARTAAAVTGVR